MIKKFNFGNCEVEIGKVARQAQGAVWFRQGGTVLLATVVSAETESFPGFFPLSVEYRELFSAAGKIPGGYFKREGKYTDKEVLTARLIDRAIRPLFPENFFDQVQILVTVYSVDKEHTPNTVALLASSIALGLSKLPFMGPVGAVEMARVDGKWIVNPVYDQISASSVRLVIAGTQEGITMVEGSCDELSEQEFLDALFQGHQEIKKQVAWQLDIQKECAVVQNELKDRYQWNVWQDRVTSLITDADIQSLYKDDKKERNQALALLKERFAQQYTAEIEAQDIPLSVIDYMFEMAIKDAITEKMMSLEKRVDGRVFGQVRAISTETGLLPFTHGSALFTRGSTQALVSLTLGGGQDEQKTEELMGSVKESAFMLHYNFPPFSVGEVKPMRGPSRRDVGHGHLAASAFIYMLPEKESFPYTIRIVSEILESNGSSSMATVCGSTMALMQAGVPIKKMVGGIAMGLLMNKAGSFAVLTDINGFEDNFGLMDFKVAGTREGITAIQMDIKYKGGLSRAVFEKALAQAKEARLHILGEMSKVMDAPSKELSALVPRVISFKVNTDKIGAIIGGGGKVIREIIEKTKTNIDIESDGLVKIFGTPGESDIDRAITWVKTLAGLIERGAVFHGIVRRTADFGLFVELVPGVDGLVHISMIPKDKQKKLNAEYPVDSALVVEVVDYDDSTGRIRLRLKE